MVVNEIVEAIERFLDRNEYSYLYNPKYLRFDFNYPLTSSVLISVRCVLIIQADGKGCWVKGLTGIKARNKENKELDRFFLGIKDKLKNVGWQIYRKDIELVTHIDFEGCDILSDSLLNKMIHFIPQIIDNLANSIIKISMGISDAETELYSINIEEIRKSTASNNGKEKLKDCDVSIEMKAVEVGSEVLDSILLWIQNTENK